MNCEHFLIFTLIATLSGCGLFAPCNTDNSQSDPTLVKRLTCVNAIEYIDENTVRFIVEKGCPVYFTNEKGEKIEDNALQVSYSMHISDEHYRNSSKIVDINEKNVVLETGEAWHYPTSERCSSGKHRGKVVVKPYGC